MKLVVQGTNALPRIGPLEEIKHIASVYGCLFHQKKFNKNGYIVR